MYVPYVMQPGLDDTIDMMTPSTTCTYMYIATHTATHTAWYINKA